VEPSACHCLLAVKVEGEYQNNYGFAFALCNLRSTLSVLSKTYVILNKLGLYINTLKIGHKSCNILSILNKLSLQKKLQTYVTNNVFWTKKVKTQQQNNK